MCVLCARTNSTLSFLSCSWTLNVKALWDLIMRLKYFTYEISPYNTRDHLKSVCSWSRTGRAVYPQWKHLLKLRIDFLPHATCSAYTCQHLWKIETHWRSSPQSLLVWCWGINRTCAFFPHAKPQQYTVVGTSHVILSVGQTECSSEAPWWKAQP